MDLDELLGRHPWLSTCGRWSFTLGIMADSGGSGGSDDEDEDDSSSDGDNEDEDDDDDESDDKEEDAAKSRREERYRKQRNDARARMRQMEEEISKLKGKDKEDVEQIKEERDKFLERAEKAEEELSGQLVRLSVLESMGKHNFNPKRTKAIVREVLSGDHGEIEIDDDGEVDGVEEALKSVASEYDEWILSDNQANGDGSSSESSTKTGTSGKPTNKKKAGGQKLDREFLAKKYPALRK